MTPAPKVERRAGQTVIRLEIGDLTALAVDAIVFYAREDLALGSGYGTAIQVRGGDSIKKELAKIGGVRPSEAVITAAGNLKSKYIVHACGPKFNEPEVERKLRATMERALAVAEEKGIRTLAFPPMGAGFYGIPLPACAAVMLAVLVERLGMGSPLEEVIVCARDRREFLAFEEKLKEVPCARKAHS
ncbi:MAG: macro domain-containing protein [Bryobacteraceae bacterium]